MNKLCVDCPNYGSFALYACPIDCAGHEDTENQVSENTYILAKKTLEQMLLAQEISGKPCEITPEKQPERQAGT